MASFLMGKRAIIIGGSGTIGKAIGKRLLLQGANVVLVGRNVESLKNASEELEVHKISKDEQTISTASCDITSEDSVVDLFSSLDKDGVDLLINNAGTMGAGKTEDVTCADMVHNLNVNVLGPFLCSREVLKMMKKKNIGGRIINVGTIAAQSPRPNSVTYTTSKYAIAGLSQSLALDARDHNIAVGIIHPGNVMSNLLDPEMIKVRQATEGFMEADAVAQCVTTMANLPYSANVLELTVMPTGQPLVGRG